MTEDQVYGVTCVDSATGLSLGGMSLENLEGKLTFFIN